MPTPTSVPSLADIVAVVRPGIVRIATELGTGSGVIVDQRGTTSHVLTAYHVIAGATQISVSLSDGTRYSASLLGLDAKRDLAVLSYCCSQASRVVAFGNSQSLRSGEEVLAIGYPLGLTGEATVTRGIVSATRFDTELDAWVVQTDAPVNAGSSGGALLNSSGRLIGIISYRIRGSSGSVEGFGFAVMERSISPVLPGLQLGTMISTPTPTRTATPTPLPTTSAVGPTTGVLVARVDSRVDARTAVNFVNGKIRVVFFNPVLDYSMPPAYQYWDYGIQLVGPGGESHSIVLRRAMYGTWYQFFSADGSTNGSVELRREVSGAIDVGVSGVNIIELDVRDNQLALTINGTFQGLLQLNGRTLPSEVRLVAGWFVVAQAPGTSTRWSGFQIAP